jgi:phosphoribosylaminoimidazole-succinocarboxamide synthase
MKEKLRKQIEEVFENTVSQASQNNPMKGTPFSGMIIFNAIANASEACKRSFAELKLEFGLTEDETNSLVDEESAKIIEKYLKF